MLSLNELASERLPTGTILYALPCTRLRGLRHLGCCERCKCTDRRAGQFEATRRRRRDTAEMSGRSQPAEQQRRDLEFLSAVVRFFSSALM